jgi:superfamily II DNA helicase RecQ
MEDFWAGNEFEFDDPDELYDEAPIENLNYTSGKFDWDIDLRKALKETFGYGFYRPNQLGIINATLSGKDCLALIPTGGGKSLTF